MMIRPLVKKTGCKVRITKKIGLPFRFLIFRKRRIFLLGIIICMAIVFVLSLFIWKIEFVGNTMYTDDQLTRFLRTESHYSGMWKRNVDCRELEKSLLKEYGYINWVTCEMKGTKLTVRIEEGRFNVPIEDKGKPCDILADKKGIITSIVTRKGSPQVVKGDVVEKGDVLVSGTLEIKELEEIKAIEFTHADADIYIKTFYEYHDELDYKYLEKVYTGRKKRDLSINILNYKINLFKPRIKYRDYDKIYTSKEVCLFDNFYLPVRYDTASYEEFGVIEKTYTEDEVKNILEGNINRFIEELTDEGNQIMSQDIKVDMQSHKAVADGIIVLIEKIGEKKYFEENERRLQYEEYFREDNPDST